MTVEHDSLVSTFSKRNGFYVYTKTAGFKHHLVVSFRQTTAHLCPSDYVLASVQRGSFGRVRS